MERLLKRNVWLELCIAIMLFAAFGLLAAYTDILVVEAIPGTIPAAFFPGLVSSIITVLCAGLVIFAIISVRHMLRGKVDLERVELDKSANEAGRFVALFAYMGVLLTYLGGLYYLGFLLSTPLAMLLIALLLGLRRWFSALICYCLFTYALYWCSLHLMKIILPEGIVWQFLG